MPLRWIDVSGLSFRWMLMLEEHQVSLLPSLLSGFGRGGAGFLTALRGNPEVEWYLRHLSPCVGDWIDGLR